MEEILSDERKGVKQAVVSYMNRLRRESEERLRVESMYEKESEFYKKGINLIAGIDEVGRGPLAGPVTVAAVILPAHWFASGLNDSKKVTPRHREELSRKIRDAAVDAMPLHFSIPTISLIHGDAISASVAAASIVAKVYRDSLMDEYDARYPGYGFKQNKGYGTADHISAIHQLGINPIHRKSFEPIKSMILEGTCIEQK